MSTKLILALSVVAVVSTAHSAQAPAADPTPTPASVAGLLERAGEPTRILGLTCARRPSLLFGPEVFRCQVRAESRTASPAQLQLTLTLAAHDGGWVIVSR